MKNCVSLPKRVLHLFKNRLYFKIQAGTACGKWTNLAVLPRNKDKVSVLLNNRYYNTEKEKKVEVKNCIFYSAKMKNI